MNKRLLLSLLVIVVLFTITGCGSNNKSKNENNTKENEKTSSIIGTWESKDYIWTFNEDKTCSYYAAGQFSNCTYEIDGEHLYVTYTGEDNPWNYKFSLDGDKLKIVFPLGEEIYTRK